MERYHRTLGEFLPLTFPEGRLFTHRGIDYQVGLLCHKMERKDIDKKDMALVQ
jgi:hypothetical protein